MNDREDKPTMDYSPPTAAYTEQSLGVTPQDQRPIAAGPDSQAKRVGRYEILSVLGKGGMGIAYKAWDPKLKRVVALKMIKSGDDVSSDELARFRTEAEAIAQVKHSHIVQIFDVGEHEKQPYFAMEYCAGGSLSDRLKKQPLPPREAAVLVEQTARGVAAAHAERIIHRDLKPANILLTEKQQSTADGAPSTAKAADGSTKASRSGGNSSSKESTAAICKVTDFGLAKHLDSDDGRTRTGAIMGTPSYMAPEQAFGQTKNLTPAADIYSLGAILYETLTGVPPFRGATVADTLDLVRNQDPVPIRQLQPKVPRDLETIAMKCLRKETSRRYDTAEELADELKRYLDGRPILARPAGVFERTWRWCRRNPVIALLLTISGVSLAALIALWATFTIDLNLQKERAETNEKKAIAKTKLARQSEKNLMDTVENLATIIADKKLNGIPGMEQVRKELLAEAAEAFKTQLENQDDPDPAIRREAGLAFQRASKLHGLMGDRAKRLAYLQAAEKIQRSLIATDPGEAIYISDLAKTLNNLGLGSKDDFNYLDEARILRADLVTKHAGNATYLTQLGRTHSSFGTFYSGKGNLPEAEKNYMTALTLHESALNGDPKHQEALGNMVLASKNFAIFNYKNGDFAQAIKYGQAAVDWAKKLYDITKKPDHQQELGASYYSLAGHYSMAEKYNEGRENAVQAVNITKNLADKYRGLPAYRHAHAMSRAMLGMVLGELKRLDEAEVEFQQAHEILKELAQQESPPGQFHFDYAKSFGDLGMIQLNQKKYPSAKAHITEAMTRIKKIPPTRDSYVKTYLGKAYLDMGNILEQGFEQREEARKHYRQAIAILEPESRLPGRYEARNFLIRAQQFLNAK